MSRIVLAVAPLLLVLAAGCSQPAQDEAQSTAEQARETVVPPDAVAAHDLGGANVTWVGKGETTFPVSIPNGTARLWVSWWDSGRLPTSGNEVHSVVQMQGCPDNENLGASGGAVGSTWCDDPPVGNFTVTWRMDVGHLEGRVCVRVAPHRDEPWKCDYAP